MSDQKKVVSFFLDNETMAKLDAIAECQRRNRSTQVAFLIDGEYARLFGQPQPTETEERPVQA